MRKINRRERKQQDDEKCATTGSFTIGTPHNIRVTTSRRMRCDGHAVGMTKTEMHTGFCWGKTIWRT